MPTMTLTWSEFKRPGLVELTAKKPNGELFAVVHHETGFAWFVHWNDFKSRERCKTRKLAELMIETRFKELVGC